MENRVTFSLQSFDRVTELTAIFHDLKSRRTGEPHHFQFQFAREMLISALQENFTDFVIEIFGVEHQPIHVERNSMDLRLDRLVVFV